MKKEELGKIIDAINLYNVSIINLNSKNLKTVIDARHTIEKLFPSINEIMKNIGKLNFELVSLYSKISLELALEEDVNKMSESEYLEKVRNLELLKEVIFSRLNVSLNNNLERS